MRHTTGQLVEQMVEKLGNHAVQAYNEHWRAAKRRARITRKRLTLPRGPIGRRALLVCLPGEQPAYPQALSWENR
jgi:hypothetical protein